MLDQPIHIQDSEFEEKVLGSSTPVLVDFWAPWCGPCLMVAPALESIARDYAGHLIIAKVNTDENPEWAMRFGVRGIPTMLFVQNGQVKKQQVGALPEPLLRKLVDDLLAEPEQTIA